MKFSLTFSTLAFLTSAAGALASENVHSFQASDQEPATGFQAGQKPDVLGVTIGMTPEEVATVFADFPKLGEFMPTTSLPRDSLLGTGYVTVDREMTISARDGAFRVEFEPLIVTSAAYEVNHFNAAYNAKRPTQNQISVVYGTGFTGNRAQIIWSKRFFDEVVDRDTLYSALTEKYGQPGLSKKLKGGEVLLYAYSGGALSDNKAMLENCLDPNYMPRKMGLDPETKTWKFDAPQLYLYGRVMLKNSHPCDAGLRITLYHGATENLVRGIEVSIIDVLAVWQDQNMANDYINKELQRQRDTAQGSKVAPKL